MNYKSQCLKVIEYCNKQKIKVILNDVTEDCCYPHVKLIYISTGQTWQNRLYTLLHEIGHMKIYKKRKEWLDYFSCYACDETDGRKMRSISYQVSLVAEEIEAWKIGMKLGKKLGVHIDKNKYNAIMNKCIMSYISSAKDAVYV